MLEARRVAGAPRRPRRGGPKATELVDCLTHDEETHVRQIRAQLIGATDYGGLGGLELLLAAGFA